MALCRNTEDCDLYVMVREPYGLECYGCDNGDLLTLEEAVIHFRTHAQGGDKVPADLEKCVVQGAHHYWPRSQDRRITKSLKRLDPPLTSLPQNACTS